MKKLLSILVLLFACQIVFTGISYAQDRNVVGLKSKDVIKTRSLNPNIKDKNLNDPESNTSSDKKAGNEDAQECKAGFENYTEYLVDIYIDGYYKGTIPAWGKTEVVLSSAYSEVYCISTGQTKEWRTNGDCKGNYTWKLEE